MALTDEARKEKVDRQEVDRPKLCRVTTERREDALGRDHSECEQGYD